MHNTAYEMRICDWSSAVCSSDLSFIEILGIDTRIPGIAGAKFARAQTLYLLGWVDVGLIKAGELAALIALDLAVMDRYGGQIARRKRSFAALLTHMEIGRASCRERGCQYG